MPITRTIDLTILDLGHIETALEAYIDDAIDARKYTSNQGTETEDEYAELGVIIEEAGDLLVRIRAAQGR